MKKLPRISGRECIKALEKLGFSFKRQEGSHIILRKDDPFAQIVVPDHKELDRETLRAIIRQANLSVDEFIEALQDMVSRNFMSAYLVVNEYRPTYNVSFAPPTSSPALQDAPQGPKGRSSIVISALLWDLQTESRSF